MAAVPGFLTKDTKFISLQPAEGGDVIYLQPFIEEFSHTIQPHILKETFGMFGAPTQTLAGLSENTYRLRVLLPAHDFESAKTNFEKVQKIKGLVNPSLEQLSSSTGKVKFLVRTLTDGFIIGQLISCEETIDIEPGWMHNAGFQQMYPQLIRLSITFVRDEMLTAEFTQAAAGGGETGNFCSKNSNDGKPVPGLAAFVCKNGQAVNTGTPPAGAKPQRKTPKPSGGAANTADAVVQSKKGKSMSAAMGSKKEDTNAANRRAKQRDQREKKEAAEMRTRISTQFAGGTCRVVVPGGENP